MSARAALAAALALGLGLARPAGAEPCSSASAIVAGQAAPCSGVLWPSVATAAALKCARVDLPTCQADAAKAATVAAVDLEACAANVSAWRQLAEARQVMIDKLATAPAEPPPPWYTSRWIAAGAGAILGAAATGGAVYLAGRLTR